jgi:hypothetical protein
MANERINYRKLGGLGTRQESLLAGSASRVRLYLGPDHLLLVEKTNYRECYRRFYYRDIQAFLMLKTNRWLWISMGFLGLGLLFGAIALTTGSNPTGSMKVVFAVIAGLCFLTMGINWWSGQSCKCYLKTAVQYEELTPLRRENQAIKALFALRGLILAAQGAMPANDTGAAVTVETRPTNLPPFTPPTS